MKITLKIFIVFLFLSLFMFRPTPSYAWHHDGWRGHSYVDVNLGVWPGDPYYGYPYYPYADPYYYPATAVVVASPNYQPVVVNGVTYFVNNGVYYLYTQNGYQAVATPVGASAPVIQAAVVTTPAVTNVDEAITINIPNAKGGYTAVILKKSGNGFTGPQGEFYSEFPKVSQLQTMYGK